jgi:hypothetical protein
MITYIEVKYVCAIFMTVFSTSLHIAQEKIFQHLSLVSIMIINCNSAEIENS